VSLNQEYLSTIKLFKYFMISGDGLEWNQTRYGCSITIHYLLL